MVGAGVRMVGAGVHHMVGAGVRHMVGAGVHHMVGAGVRHMVGTGVRHMVGQVYMPIALYVHLLAMSAGVYAHCTYTFWLCLLCLMCW